MGVPMVNLVYHFPGIRGNIQGLIIPFSSPNRMPALSEYISVETPELAFENVEGGIRALIYPGPLSLSVSYLTILDRYPSDALETVSFPVTMPSVLGHSRQQIVGFDAVWLVNGFDLRMEWAYTHTQDADHLYGEWSPYHRGYHLQCRLWGVCG